MIALMPKNWWDILLAIPDDEPVNHAEISSELNSDRTEVAINKNLQKLRELGLIEVIPSGSRQVMQKYELTESGLKLKASFDPGRAEEFHNKSYRVLSESFSEKKPQPMRKIILSVLHKRTGAVSRMEMYAAIENYWLDGAFKPSRRLIGKSLGWLLEKNHVEAARTHGHDRRERDLFIITESGKSAFINSAIPLNDSVKCTHVTEAIKTSSIHRCFIPRAKRRLSPLGVAA